MTDAEIATLPKGMCGCSMLSDRHLLGVAGCFLDSTEIATLHREWQALQGKANDARATLARLDRLAGESELLYLNAAGEGECLRAKWLKAWLAGESRECKRLLRLMYGPEEEA